MDSPLRLPVDLKRHIMLSDYSNVSQSAPLTTFVWALEETKARLRSSGVSAICSLVAIHRLILEIKESISRALHV